MTDSRLSKTAGHARERAIETSPVIRFHIRNAVGILMVLFGLVISILVMMAMDYNRHDKRYQSAIEAHFEEQVTHLDTLLYQVTSSMEIMRSLAESDLDATQGQAVVAMPPAADHLREADGYFHMDTAAATAGKTGNLTGLGTLSGRDPDFLREVRAALAVNPLLAAVQKAIQTSAWVYYISSRSMLNLYPWVPSSEWKFSPDSYRKDFYTLSLPQKNPAKTVYWTPVYVDEVGKGLMTTCGIPVYDRDRHLGALAVDLTVDFLNDIVRAFRPAFGTLFLVNAQSQILAHPGLTSSKDPTIKTFGSAMPVLLSLAELRRIPANTVHDIKGWHLVRAGLTHAPWQAVYVEKIPTMWQTILDRIGWVSILIFLGLLALVLFVLISTHYLFVLPSDRFARYILWLSRNEFDREPGPVPRMWRPWFATIRHTFQENHQLTDRIRRAKEALEDRVAQRTRELTGVNRALSEEIQERKRAQEEERKTAKILAQAISQSPSGIVIVNARDMTLQRANKAALDIMPWAYPDGGPGLDALDRYFPGWRFYDRDGEPFPVESLPLYKAIKDGVVTRDQEILARHRKGRDVWLSVNAAPIRDDQDRILAGIVVFHNISALKEREAALHASEQQYREMRDLYKQLSDASFEAIFLSREGICTGQNRRAEKMFGYTAKQALGRHGTDWIHPDYREHVARKMAAGLKGPYEAVALRKDGSTFPCEIQARMGQEGDIRITALRDITSRKMAEQEKLEAQAFAATQSKHALVGQVAGKMAHDFNNILGVIMGNAELALADCGEPELVRILELILGQTQRGKNMTRNLVAFARDQEPRQARFDIHKTIDLVIDLLQKDLAGIEVSRVFQDGLPRVLADPGMIEHMLVNLIQNSVHATGKTRHPMIWVRTFGSDQRIGFDIQDNGCGIPERYQDQIFDPAFTLKGSRDVSGAYLPDTRGTGYGMANVKKYVEQHKGSIRIQSRQGRGTCVSIELPVIAGELSFEEKEEITGPGIRTCLKILVVEDEKAISDIQARILSQPPLNHEVDVAGNGAAALELLGLKSYDLISLDYLLPGEMNGIDVYRCIRKTHKTVPVLFVSGNIEFLESIKTMTEDDPCLAHLSKPCLNRDYIRHINQLLAL